MIDDLRHAGSPWDYCGTVYYEKLRWYRRQALATVDAGEVARVGELGQVGEV